MLRTMVVVWLAILVLALAVVGFVTRTIEKRRRTNRFPKPSESPLSVTRKSELSILE